MLSIVFQSINKSMISGLKEGVVPLEHLYEFRLFLDGNATDRTISIAKKYFIEANSKLNFFKLSTQFEDQKHVVQKQLFRAYISAPKISAQFNSLYTTATKSQRSLFQSIQDIRHNLDENVKKVKGSQDIGVYELIADENGETTMRMTNEQTTGQEYLANAKVLANFKAQVNDDGQMAISKRQRKKLKTQIDAVNFDNDIDPEVIDEQIRSEFNEVVDKPGEEQAN